MTRLLLALLAFTSLTVARGQDFPAIKRRLPPVGKALKDTDRVSLRKSVDALQKQIAGLTQHPRYADAAVLIKSVEFALMHDEFYKEGDIKKARAILKAADSRIESLRKSEAPWTQQRGRVVLGYRSEIDGSLQPYGMEIPEKLDLSKPQPLYVWLHGRGDSTTDMHFIDQRINRAGKIAASNALIVHPLGRQCVGYKHAGEVDVIDVIEQVASRYKIDRQRIVLIGFSMGGAGTWHVGAHFTDRFAAVCPGAGFAETKQYQNITPDKYPSRWEQTLWHVYDVPSYVRNLFNTRVIAYSGEKDKQIQAARVMETAYQSEGQQLDHRIGPGMGHRYHPDTLAGILKDIEATLAEPADPLRPLHLQTRTLRYNQMRWVTLTGLKTHYADTRVDAVAKDGTWTLRTANVTRMEIDPPGDASSIVIDDQQIALPSERPLRIQRAADGKWAAASKSESSKPLKTPGLQGPIDDIFKRPFLVVLPSGQGIHKATDRWVKHESQHFVERWQALMRGKLRVKLDHEVTAEDIDKFHLVLWGDPASNTLLRRVANPQIPNALPLHWDAKTVGLGRADNFASSTTCIPIMIYPNPLNPTRYVAINAGLTFREAQDRTNSLQNPRLPDWAIISIRRAPDAEEPGETVAAGFFNEQWQP